MMYLKWVLSLHVKEAITKRRAYRALASIEITDSMIQELAASAQLAASCFNNQPWHFVFVRDPKILTKLHEVMSKNNRWVQGASLIIAVYSSKEEDCLHPDREYFLFDTGMATGQLILRATEMNLVAHPIAGFDEKRAKNILDIPPDKTLITLIIVGKHSPTSTKLLSEKQIRTERQRPTRKPFEESVRII